MTTADGSAAVEVCRLACGGHGYLASSNFPVTYGLVTAASTYEGENTVLLLQTSRYLMKAWHLAISGQPLTPTVAYLEHAIRMKSPRWEGTIPGIISAMQTCTANKIRLAYENVERRKKTGMSQEEAVNATSIELASAADAHCRTFLVKASHESITNQIKNLSPALGAVLKDIVELYAVDAALKSLGDILRYVQMTDGQVSELQLKLENVLARLRPNAVGLVDRYVV